MFVGWKLSGSEVGDAVRLMDKCVGVLMVHIFIIFDLFLVMRAMKATFAQST